MDFPRFRWTVTGMVRDDEAVPPGSYRYIDARGEPLIRDEERAACADLARRIGRSVGAYDEFVRRSGVNGDYVLREAFREIHEALAAAIEARGRA